MSDTSYNGWPADEDLEIRSFAVAGVAFAPGIRADVYDDLATVFAYIIGRLAEEGRPPKAGQCFGFNYRPNVNNPSVLSCHSSATAVDWNSLDNPNGHEASPALIELVNGILAEIPELADLVHWGGNWHAPSLTPDPMHFELHAHDPAMLRRVADRIRNQEDPMAGITIDDIETVVSKAIDKALVEHDRETKALIRKLFTNQRVILKERFGTTDADLDELLGKVEDLVDQ
jgi:hypothetical protein